MASFFGGLGSLAKRLGPGKGQPDEAPLDPRPRYDGVPVDSLPEPLLEVRRGSRRTILVTGNPILHAPCREVIEFGTPTLRSLIDDMFTTMAIANGVGLAANQIGVELRVFVYDCRDAYGVRHVGHVVNPKLEQLTAAIRREWHSEGCLSVPGPTADVARSVRAVVRGQDVMGKPILLEGTGTLARCLQHETDHLRGVIYLDHLAGRERHRVLQEMEEMQESVWADWDDRAAGLGKPSHLGPYHP